MPLKQVDFAELEQLVNAPNKNEVRCMQLLATSCQELVGGTIVSIDTLEEDRNFFGDSDLVVSALIRDDLNAEVRKAYLWELKAPQCALMERDDNNNRYRPTLDFIKAENQLIHYYDEAIGSRNFRDRARVDEANIFIGGIIIGRRDTITKHAATAGEQQRAWKSLGVRTTYLHSKHNIRVVTWDRVLELLRPV